MEPPKNPFPEKNRLAREASAKTGRLEMKHVDGAKLRRRQPWGVAA